jgi:hypothetical protein
MINLNSYRRRQELEDVLEDLSYSLIECNDALLRKGIEDNIADIEAELDQLEDEE